MYVYHSWLNILDTNNAFHGGTILEIDGINIRIPFFFHSSGIQSILFSPEQTLWVWNKSVSVEEVSEGITCLLLQMELRYASVARLPSALFAGMTKHLLVDTGKRLK